MRNAFHISFILVLMLIFCLGSFKSPSKISDKINEKEIKIGKSFYIKFSCISCHGKNGKLLGDLTKAYQKYTDREIINYIKRPDKYNNPQMPRFEDIIPESSFPYLIAYIKYLGKTAHKK